jgi:hypothetical protein
VGKVFISYSWKQGRWVWERLVPVLRAAAIDVLFDRERFRAGKDVLHQMDKLQDEADRHILCLSADYLASAACKHEMKRAFGRNPDFKAGKVIPLRLDAAALPKPLAAKPITIPKPLWIDFSDDGKPEPWKSLVDACEGDLGGSAVRWLEARDRCFDLLARRASVCLHVTGERANWRALMDDVLERLQPPSRQIDLDRGATKTRPGLVNCILGRPAHHLPAGGNGHELVELDQAVMGFASPLMLALRHFDHMSDGIKADADLFDTLRYLVMDARKLVLFVQTRTPFATLLPPDHSMSKIDVKTVELP